MFESTSDHPAGAAYLIAAPLVLPLFQKATTIVWPAAGALGNVTAMELGANALPLAD